MTETSKKFDSSFFKKISLIPFFAFIGLGADSLSSASYGPEEAFLWLQSYPHLLIFVGILSVITIWMISISYCQIIERFPFGGGGYVVASKLLSPTLGVVSGCALLIDYVLTITISVAAGVDAMFSLFAYEHHGMKFLCKIVILCFMGGMNLRGVKESVFPWIPIFILFVAAHLFLFMWGFFYHSDGLWQISAGVQRDIALSTESLGTLGVALLIIHAYSVGAGTYTGIEAVSNGMNIFREPKVHNGKKTMFYISAGLAVCVFGLIVSYLLYGVQPQQGKTLNAVLVQSVGSEMGGLGQLFCFFTLLSEAGLLVMAAQSGFFDGPRVIANMAADRWMPSKFTNLSDKFVLRHGITLITCAAILLMMYTHGNVAAIVVLYSLSVFITFSLSQLGMCNHWASERAHQRPWLKGLIINGAGLCLVMCIFITLLIVKFKDGAWLTVSVVSVLVLFCFQIKRYYSRFTALFSSLSINIPVKRPSPPEEIHLEPSLHTIVMFAGGSKSLTLHSISEVLQLFGNSIAHFVFIHVGLIDTGVFKGKEAVEALEEETLYVAEQLTKTMTKLGYSSESLVSVGIDIGEEVVKLAIEAKTRHPTSLFVGNKIVLPKETIVSRWLHNQTLFVIERRIYELGYPFVTVPIYI